MQGGNHICSCQREIALLLCRLDILWCHLNLLLTQLRCKAREVRRHLLTSEELAWTTKQSLPISAPGTHFFCNDIRLQLPTRGLADIKFRLQIGNLLFVEPAGLLYFLQCLAFLDSFALVQKGHRH